MLLLHISCFILTITLVQSQLYDKNPVRMRRGDGFVFPDDNPTSNEQNAVTPPLAFFEQLNEIGNISDFLNKFIEEGSMDPRDFIESRIDGGVERSLGITPKAAGCETDLEIVSLKPDNAGDDPTIIYYPSCTRVKRCSGCCSNKLLSCQPTEIETKTFQVIKTQYVIGGKLAYKGKVPVIVEEHTKCNCKCVTQAKDCNQFQKYNPSQCKCVCNSPDDKIKCLNNDLKIWDDSCTCRCKEIKDCTTGSYFDHNHCECIGEPFYQRSSPGPQQPFDRRQYILKAIPVAQNDNTKYQI